MNREREINTQTHIYVYTYAYIHMTYKCNTGPFWDGRIKIGVPSKDAPRSRNFRWIGPTCEFLIRVLWALIQDLPQGGFKVTSATVELYISRSGIHFDNSEIASPGLSGSLDFASNQRAVSHLLQVG